MAKRAASPASKATEPTPEHRVLILHGKERLLQETYVRNLREALEALHGGADGVDTVRFDGQSAQVADVLDECRSFGLMQQHKLVIVDNAEAFVKSSDDDGGGGRGSKSPREMLESYCAEPSDSATLVLRSETWRPGNLDKAAAKVGVVLKCEPLAPGQAAAWAVGRTKRRHRSEIDKQAAAMLVDAVGTDLARIDSELAKLAAAADPGPITADLVRDFVGASKEESAWEIQRFLLSGDPQAALRHLRHALEISRHHPTFVMYWYLDLARKLNAMCQGIATGQNPNSLAGHLKLWGPGRDAVINAGRRLPPRAATELFRATVDADQRQKSGRADQVRSLEALTLRFTSVVPA